MDNKPEIIEEAVYANINKNLKDRAILYITQAKLLGNTKTDSIKGLIEEALDFYMISNPINSKL